MRRRNTLGILREVKSKWERRVPVVPAQVKQLVASGLRVLIQPCERRVFKDVEFEKAGAVVTEDISEANAIVGVKQFPSRYLAEGKSYMTFNHVIKAQEENMPFLDECLKKNVRLFDYECIREAPDMSSHKRPERLVAFGRFAGLAGMVTGMRGLGEHLLAKGAATAFLNISSTFTYSSLEVAKAACVSAGQNIAKYGLPRRFGPLTFVFTGAGNVTGGALELFRLFPHEFVTPEQLPDLEHNFDNRKLYGCILPTSALVSPTAAAQSVVGDVFDEEHYFVNPEMYEPVFHKRIAPFARVVVNGMYWDRRYPRLLTCEQLAHVHTENPSALMAAFDITCDIGGSLEFLSQNTSSEQPFFVYDPLCHRVSERIDGDGVLVLGVDALPAELPKEASEYFSSVLTPFLPALVSSDLTKAIAHLDDWHSTDLPPELFHACIASDNALCLDYAYIDTLRKSSGEAVRSEQPPVDVCSNVVRIDGHLFDSGVINQLLDLVEGEGARYTIVDLVSGVNTKELRRATRLVLQIDCDAQNWAQLRSEIGTLIKLVPKSEAIVRDLPFGALATDSHLHRRTVAESTLQKITRLDTRIGDEKKVLVLGSGFVAKPVVDYLCYSGQNWLTVASKELATARRLCAVHPFAKELHYDLGQDATDDYSQLNALVKASDAVVSLLPATMHLPVAQACVRHGVDLVTASYVSDDMRALDGAAKESGVSLLNEVGLDPGLDHMSALRLIREAQGRGETVRSFWSVCGGLPAPECADNPLGYKFSWSPLGVLRAAGNSARFLRDGVVHEIDGGQLLRSAQPLADYSPWLSLALEHLPNRNAMQYVGEYQIPTVHTMYRGTLRYAGFCKMLDGFKALGLLQSANGVLSHGKTWPEYLGQVIASNSATVGHSAMAGTSATIALAESTLRESGVDFSVAEMEKFVEFCEWLGLFSMEACMSHAFASPMEALCALLELKLCFKEGERDSVLMHHRIETEASDGATRRYTSTLTVSGDDDYSAMARTVGFPVALSTQAVLDGKLKTTATGVVSAHNPTLIAEVLSKAPELGFEFKETLKLPTFTSK